MRFHPDGMASLIAVIVAPVDVENQPVLGVPKSVQYQQWVDYRHEQVLGLARQYYKINPCDFDNSFDVKIPQQRNAINNRAKLDRRNLQ